MNKIRVMIVDDHQIARAGVRALLEREQDVEVVGEVASGEEALQELPRLRPHVVLMDLGLPGMSGIEATREVKGRFPAVEVLPLTIKDDPEHFFAVLEAGASGYLLKETEPRDMVVAIRAVAGGAAYFSPQMARVMLSGYREKERRRLLSHREEEVFRMAAQGKTNREMAQELCLSIKTVEKHRARVMEKLGLHTRADLLKYALAYGIMEQGTFGPDPSPP
jgi:two-component system response regulator NreC